MGAECPNDGPATPAPGEALATSRVGGVLARPPVDATATVGDLHYPRGRAGPDQLPSRAWDDSGLAGRLQVPRSGPPGDLCRQGEEPPAAAELLLRRRRRTTSAHRADGADRRRGRVDGGVHRGRGAPAGIQLDQGVRPAVQRALPRRQVLPGTRRDGGGAVPAAAGDAGCAPQGGAVLRSLRPRVGDPGDVGPAVAGVPGPDLLHRGVQALGPDRQAVPARLHRQVLGTVRRPGDRGGAPRDRRRLLRLHGGQGRSDDPTAGAGDVRRRRRPGLREGGAAARRPVGAAPGGGEAGGGARQRHRRRRDRDRRGRTAGVGAGVPRQGRPGTRAAGLDRRRGRRRRDR